MALKQHRLIPLYRQLPVIRRPTMTLKLSLQVVAQGHIAKPVQWEIVLIDVENSRRMVPIKWCV